MNNYQSLINSQTILFNSNFTKPITFRIAQLTKLKALLKNNEKDLYEAIYNDFKKSEFETYATELAILYAEINDALKNIKQWSKRKYVKTNLANLPALSYIIPEPLGVTLVIGAWNYPYQLSFGPVIAAMAAGNTIVLKPSELASHTSAIMAQLINTNFDANYFKVIEGGVTETTALLNLPWDKLFFTGSVPVGKIVYQAAAKHLTPVTLELGGKSPAIVTANCNLKETVKRLVWAKFLNAGQTCIAPDYVVVEASIHDAFIDAVKQQIADYNYSFENNNYVQIINTNNFNRLSALINNKQVVVGGNTDAAKRYIAPTVMDNVSWIDNIMKDEIFGPLLPIITYTNINEVIIHIKQRPKPLSCYVFTNDCKLQDKILTEISFGGGAVNDALMHISNSHLPFGGVGCSGMGNYHGEAGFKAFSHYKSILQKPFWLETNLKYPPYSTTKLNWIKKILE
ncbi:MAG: aldehyde dehydrogenase [Bacteroidia bacterium]|nr:aldehyde dehydrogenase [Bacteroidia bacterium]